MTVRTLMNALRKMPKSRVVLVPGNSDDSDYNLANFVGVVDAKEYGTPEWSGSHYPCAPNAIGLRKYVLIC